jgi:4a-hydroxytetrahydrobiopterin dehydratase
MRCRSRLKKLTSAEVAAQADLGGWSYDAAACAIRKQYDFHSFGDAIAFIVQGALIAEKRDHHPDWTCSFNIVQVKLSTHDAEGVTQLDCSLARDLDAIADVRDRLEAAVRSSLVKRARR